MNGKLVAVRQNPTNRRFEIDKGTTKLRNEETMKSMVNNKGFNITNSFDLLQKYNVEYEEDNRVINVANKEEASNKKRDSELNIKQRDNEKMVNQVDIDQGQLKQVNMQMMQKHTHHMITTTTKIVMSKHIKV